MKDWVRLVFALVTALFLSGCGLTPAEQAETATQVAANIFATLTAQAPTATSTYTPSPTSTATPTATATATPTATPRPTKTPKPSPTPTPGLESIALTLDDLPAGFEAMPTEDLLESEEHYPDGSSAFGFQDDKRNQIVMAILMPLSSKVDQVGFDSMLPSLVQIMSAALGAGNNTRRLHGLEGIGEAREGMSADTKMGPLSMRMDIAAFRRGEVGVLIFIFYPSDDKPAIQIKDLARLQDERIQNFLKAASDVETIKVDLLSPTNPVPAS